MAELRLIPLNEATKPTPVQPQLRLLPLETEEKPNRTYQFSDTLGAPTEIATPTASVQQPFTIPNDQLKVTQQPPILRGPIAAGVPLPPARPPELMPQGQGSQVPDQAPAQAPVQPVASQEGALENVPGALEIKKQMQGVGVSQGIQQLAQIRQFEERIQQLKDQGAPQEKIDALQKYVDSLKQWRGQTTEQNLGPNIASMMQTEQKIEGKKTEFSKIVEESRKDGTVSGVAKGVYEGVNKDPIGAAKSLTGSVVAGLPLVGATMLGGPTGGGLYAAGESYAQAIINETIKRSPDPQKMTEDLKAGKVEEFNKIYDQNRKEIQDSAMKQGAVSGTFGALFGLIPGANTFKEGIGNLATKFAPINVLQEVIQRAVTQVPVIDTQTGKPKLDDNGKVVMQDTEKMTPADVAVAYALGIATGVPFETMHLLKGKPTEGIKPPEGEQGYPKEGDKPEGPQGPAPSNADLVVSSFNDDIARGSMTRQDALDRVAKMSPEELQKRADLVRQIGGQNLKITPLSEDESAYVQGKQAPAPSGTPTPPDGTVEAQGAANPPSPAAPTVSKSDAETLKGAGYSVADIKEMSPTEVAAEVKDAKDAGAKPVVLTKEEQTQLQAPIAEAPAAKPIVPAQAPSEQAQALVEKGVSPLEAMKEIGQGAEQPQAPEGQKAQPEQNGFERNPPKIGNQQPQFSVGGYRFLLSERGTEPAIEIFNPDRGGTLLYDHDSRDGVIHTKDIDNFLAEKGLPKELADPMRDYMTQKLRIDDGNAPYHKNAQKFIDQTVDRFEKSLKSKEAVAQQPAAQEQAQPADAMDGISLVEHTATDGTKSPVFQIGNRVVAVMDIDGIKQPFYLSTGEGGKKNVETGKWYPFFGIGPDGWFNKGTEQQIKNYYNSPRLRAASKYLDSTFGDMRNKLNTVPLGTNFDTKSIFEGLEPVAHKESSKSRNIINRVSQIDAVELKESKNRGAYTLRGWLKNAFPEGINFKEFNKPEYGNLYNPNGAGIDDVLTSVMESQFWRGATIADLNEADQDQYKKFLDQLIDDIRTPGFRIAEPKVSKPGAAQIEHYEYNKQKNRRDLYDYMRENAISHDDYTVDRALDYMQNGNEPLHAWEAAVAEQNKQAGLLSDDDLRAFLGEDLYNVGKYQAVSGVGAEGRAPSEQGTQPEKAPTLEGAGKEEPALSPVVSEAGAEGKPQLVIPGAERISQAEEAQRGAEKKLKARVEQKEPEGLFGESSKQQDLMDFAKREEKADENKPVRRIDTLSDAFQEKLQSEGFKSIAEARKLAKEFSGTEDNKLIEESMELALVREARDIVSKDIPAAEKFDKLLDLYNKQPKLETRTSESIKNQAYSTPLPLAYVASRLAGVNKEVSVLEPTAGNGALVMEANPKKTVVNEINRVRRDNLKALGFDTKGNDASVPAFVNGKFDVVIANPPFGTIKTEDGKTKSFDMDWVQYGYNTNEIDHAITFSTLDHMKKDGRGAFIIGSVSPLATSDKARSDAYNAKAKREFFLSLYNNYNVVDHFTVAGKLYERQGAAWPVDVIIIDGEGKSKLPLPAVKPPRVLGTWDDVKGELKNEFEGKVGEPHGEAIQPVEQRPAGVREEPNREPAVVERPPVGEPVVRPDERVSAESGAGKPVVAGEPTELAERAKREQSERLDELVAAGPVRVNKQETETERQVAYSPKSEKTQGLGTLVPVNMRQSIGDALQRIQDKHGSIDHYVADRLNYPVNSLSKYFSAEQVDAIGLAIDNFEKNAGFIIGDQTGIGKGRVNAAIIRYAINNNKIPIFVTEKPNLYGDMYRDMNDVGINQVTGGKEPKILMTNAAGNVPLDIEAGKYLKTGDAKSHNALLDRLAKSGKIGDYNMVFTTYSQMQTLKGKETERQRFLKSIAPNAILILDESHNAGGSGGSTDAAEGQGMNRARYVRDLVGTSSGTFYSSATYAKRPDVMDLYYKTDMSKAVDSPDALAEAISKGGVPMQQIVATMLARAGQYIRRERSFAGVRYDAPIVTVNRETYDNFSNAISQIQKFSKVIKDATKSLDAELKAEAKGLSSDRSTGGAGAESSNFTSVLHNLINQMLLASKVEPAVKEAIQSLKNGEKPVFTVANTMESFLNSVAEEEGLASGSPVNLDFGDMLNRYLERTRTIIIRQPYKKGSERHYLTDEELGPQALVLYKGIQNYISSLDFSGMPISPIDYIRNKMEKAGYKVGEITGRGTTVNYSGTTPVLSSRSSAETGAKGRIKTINDFNNGNIDAIILNQAGATGLSLHASEKFKDQRPRNMIIVQPEGNIDTHMQMLGRVHRTGQVVVPRYTQLIADIPAEKRPAAVLQKKMASLSANTTASRKGALQAENVPDFINEYGDHVAGQFLIDNPDLQIKLDVAASEPTEGLGADNADLMRKLTGRIPLLPLKQQEEVYAELESRYHAMMSQLEAQGINTLEAKNLDLDAKPLDSRIIKEGDSSSPFTEPVTYTMFDIKKQGKPISAAEAINRVAAAHESEIQAGDNPVMALEQMQNAFVQSHEATVKKAVEEFRSYQRAIIDDTAAENIEKENARLGLIRSAFDDAAKVLVPGRRVRIGLQNGETYQGIVINFAKKGKSKNPLALGSWEAAIAYPSSNPIINVPLSQVQIGGESDTKMTINQTGWADTPESLVKSFDDLATSGMREKRIIATGNLLSGFDALSGKGQIINFTDSEGAVRQGIMLPARIKSMDEAVGESKAVIKTPEELTVAISRSPTNTVTSVNGDLMITYEPRWQGYKIITPRAKDKGGKYYLDDKLIGILGNFESQGRANMLVGANAAEIKPAIQRLLDLGARFETNNDAVRSASMGLTPAAIRRGVSQVENITKNVEEIAKRVAGNLGEVSMRPLTANDVTVEEARKSGLTGDLKAPLGITSNEQGVIRMVVSTLANPLEASATAYHEADHVLDMANAFTPKERRARELAAPRLRNFLIDNGFTPQSVKQMPLNELLAHANELYSVFADSGMNTDQLHLPSALRKSFDKVLKFVEATRSWLEGNGYKNIESLMRNQYVGEIARRAMEEKRSIDKEMQPERMFSFGNEAIDKINAMNKANGMKQKGAKQPVKSFNAPAYGKIAEATRLLQDEFTYLRAIQDEIERSRGSQLPDTLDADLAQSLLPGRTSERLENFREEEVTPLVKSMQENNVSLDDLGMYMLAKHAPERNAEMSKRDPSRFGEDGGSGLLNETAAQILEEFRDSGKEAALEREAQKVRDIIKADNKRRLDSGLIDQETYDRYEQTYKHYVPLRGFAEKDAEEDHAINVGRGITASGKESKTALGRRSLSDNPAVNAIMQAQEGIIRVEKNRAAKALLRLAQTYPNEEVWQVNRLPKKRVIGEDGIVKYVPDMQKRYGDNVVVAKVGGHTNYIILNNPALAEAYRKVGAIRMNPAMQKMAQVSSFFSQLNTARNPAFFIPNVSRDFQEALFRSFVQQPKLAAAYLKNYPSALAMAVRVAAGKATPEQLGIYNDWRLSGGKVSYNSFHDAEKISADIQRILGKADPLSLSNLPQKTRDAFMGAVKKALGFLDKMAEPLESGTRLAVFKAAKETGYSNERAASFAREFTVNFDRRGAWGRAMNALYWFYNAGTQGSVNMIKLLMRGDDIGKRARWAYASLIPLGFFISLMNISNSGNDPAEKWKKQYSNIPTYILRNWMVIKTGPNEKDYVRVLPLAFALKVPYYIGEQMAMVLTGQISPQTATANVIANTVDAYNPMGSGSIWNMLMPSLLDPFFDISQNKSMPSEAPIVPKETQTNKGVPHSQQYFSSTTPTSIGIADFLNSITGGSKSAPGAVDMYPGWIDYIARAFSGGLGTTVKSVYDMADNFAQGKETPAEKIPIVKGFAPAATSEGRRYYEVHDEIDKKINQLRSTYRQIQLDPKNNEAKQEFRQRARELGADEGEKGNIVWKNGPVQAMNETDKAIAEFRKQAASVRANQKLSEADRKAQLDKIDSRIEGIMVKTRGILSRSLPERKPTFAPLSNIQ